MQLKTEMVMVRQVKSAPAVLRMNRKDSKYKIRIEARMILGDK